MLGTLRQTLSRTRQAFKKSLDGLFRSGRPREEILGELEEALVLADVGAPAAEKIIESVRGRTSKTDGPEEIRAALQADLVERLSRRTEGLADSARPSIWMIVGVNGGGKTTTIAKLAKRYASAGRKVGLAAADTFRAAAQEQLAVWGRKLDCPVFRGRDGADPASVAFDAVKAAGPRGLDLLLVDTAGRIHTNANLMQEMEKIKRIIGREIPGAPHEILLVLDASIGQNALVQARAFLQFSGTTGIVLTKLDGTAKGGIVIAIADELGLPIKLVGTGESEDDLADFSPAEFVDALFT